MKNPSLWDSPPCDSVCFKWEDFDSLTEQMLKSCKGLLDDNQMLSSLRDSKFEVVYTELFDSCASGIAELLGIQNIVVVSAFGMMPRHYDIAGISTMPSFMPVMLTSYSDEMTFVQRLLNFKTEVQLNLKMRYWEREFQKLFGTKRANFPSILQIYEDKVSLIMTNVNEFTETPRPTANMIRYIGGATLHEPKKLTTDLHEILDERNATVLFSMDLMDTFSEFPHVTFIWKYEEDDHHLFEAHANVYPMKWIPQTDLLADPRLSLFITHGGINSILEAIFHGKPMIVVPLFGDQPLNSKNVHKRGLGTVIEKHRLNKMTLTEAIRKTLGNREILRQSSFVASMLKDRPQQYRNDIAKWARLIIEHGKMDHFTLHSKSLNVFQYYSLDVVGFLLSIAAMPLFAMQWIVKRILKNFSVVKIKAN
ncbi:unnamed protein product [Nippostrongylus brasiliensis]|uniref:UDP-glucuronosyltransferase n=1 Tax=Nippostrongylus brasiliensis TaxID=27835 RepID=A0A158R1L6_NIPBR|nr:unnamed protein product [Nippostrongylus brasiliensis]